MLLWVGGIAPWGWRLLFAVPVLAIWPVIRIGRALPETRRFEASDRRAASHQRRSGRPDALAGQHRPVACCSPCSALCFDLFVTPASAFLNEFLRTDRGFAPWQISVFTILTNTPGGIGIVVGGRLADARGRRVIGAIGLGAGVAFTVLMYLATNWTIWLWSILGAVIGAMAVPALAVYGPELFPTDARGRANGVINVARAAGAAAGAFLAGVLADRLAGGLPARPSPCSRSGRSIVVGLVLCSSIPRPRPASSRTSIPRMHRSLGTSSALDGLDPDIIPDRLRS